MSTLAKNLLFLSIFFLQSHSFAAQPAEKKEAPAVQDKQEQVKQKSSSNKSVEESSIPAPVSQSLQQKNDLKHYLPKEQVTPILVGLNDYVTLVNKNIAPNPKGVAILIPDWQQRAVNPKAINFLRKALPKQGWTTLTIQPNNIPKGYPSQALKMSVQQTENKTILDNYKKSYFALLDALQKKATEYPGIVIMIVQGNHAALTVEHYSNNNVQAPNALILLSSYILTSEQLLNESNEQFAKAVANSDIPILDLYLQFDNAIVIAKAPERLALAQQEMKVYYRQRQLNNNNTGYYPEQALISQINSWLKAIGW